MDGLIERYFLSNMICFAWEIHLSSGEIMYIDRGNISDSPDEKEILDYLVKCHGVKNKDC